MSNLKHTYLFYDLETTGLNKCFDQTLQFAGIRTDMQLNELERHTINIKLNIDVVPSATAMITHQIGIKESQKGIPEIDGIKHIHQLLNTPGTISLGYNTLNFDDEFLRFSFFRNLLPSYTHQYAQSCSRMDIYPITVMYYLYKHEILNWPIINDKISLKLENLNHANQLASGRAHDALVDVEATLALAKKLHQDNAMWKYLTGYFNKKIDGQRITQLPISFMIEDSEIREGILINGKIGANLSYQAPVISLGQHKYYKNQTLWLRLDREELTKTTTHSIPDYTFAFRKKMGEQLFLLPPNERYLAKLNHECIDISNANKLWLKKNPTLFNEIKHYYQHFKYPTIPSVDIDANLYEKPFPSYEEEKLCKQFHQASPKEKIAIAMTFPDPQKQEQALRIINRHYPNILSDLQIKKLNNYLQDLTQDESKNTNVDYKGNKRRTIEGAKEEIRALRHERDLTSTQTSLLNELENFLNEKMISATQETG